jgi:hypothetical protein
MTDTADWASRFRSDYERYHRLPDGQQLAIAGLCERNAHAALRAAVAEEPIRALRVSSARNGGIPRPCYDYVLVDIVPARSRRGAVVRVVGGGAERRFRSDSEALRAGMAAHPDRLSLGIGAWQCLGDYDGVLEFVRWLVDAAPDYCQRHPELATIASDLSAAMALAELM